MASIPIIPPNAVSTGMTVDVQFSTAVNESESGVSGRKSLRDIALRQYTLTINPESSYAEEVMAIILACRGARWPVALRDWAGNYKLTASEQATEGSSTIPLYRTFTPLTGTRSFQQRILILDDSAAFTVSVNGSPITSGSYSITDPGILVISGGVTSGDTVTVTGQYLIPCVFVEDSLTMTVHAQDLFSVDNVRLREIPEAELLALIS